MVIIRTEFALALNQVATERGIEPEIVLESIRMAILAAYKKDYNLEETEGFEVKINPSTGEAKILKDSKDITPPGFGRIAAQTAKQVILQRIREAEKKAVITDFSSKIGTVISGMVLRFDPANNIIVDIGKGEAIMPVTEQVPQEHYKLNQRIAFYVVGIKKTTRGEEIIVSRSHKNLISGLFQREVPEISNGSVIINEVARDSGVRAKIAVSSNQSGVDPVGSCVGQKGIRVQAVIQELGGNEKIDIIQYSDNITTYIKAALAPTKDITINLNETAKEAQVTVSEDQLSFIIGKEGVNVRLASKLTGWRLDIKSETEVLEEKKTEKKEKKNKSVKKKAKK